MSHLQTYLSAHKSRFGCVLTAALLAFSFTSCGLFKSEPEAQAAEIGSSQPVATQPAPVQPAPVGDPYAITLTAKAATQGFTRYTLLLAGGAGPSSALLKLQLPEGAEIVAAHLDGGVVQYQDTAAMILTQGPNAKIDFDIKGIPAGTFLSVTLEEAVSAGQVLAAVMTSTATAEGEATELTALPISTDEQLANYFKAQDSTGQLTAQAASDLTVPNAIERPWLAFEPGDVNKDKKVTLDDVLALTTALLGKTKFDLSQRYLADLKDDGQVTADDLALLVAKRVSLALGVKVALPSVHPKSLVLKSGAELLVVGNAGNGPATFKVTGNAAWLGLKPLKDGVHPAVLAYEVSKIGAVPANTNASIAVEGGIQKRTVALQAVRTIEDSTQDTTTAGIDADKNGIRDEIDALIAKEYQESPAQTLAAQKFAQLLQLTATKVYTDQAQVLKVTTDQGTALACLRYKTSEDLRERAVKRLMSATYNSLERIRNNEKNENFSGSETIRATKESECI
jgi:Dockerin type I domain